MNEGKDHDRTLALLLIKLLGVYPPGSIVHLNNGEAAIVTRRSTAGSSPTVKSFLTPHGGQYTKAINRDCHNSNYTIQKSYTSEIPKNLDLDSLWDYSEDEKMAVNS